MTVIETDRLILRWIALSDAAFIVELLNDPSWLQFIGDRGVRTEEQARAYISAGPVTSYERHGFGLWLVVRKSDGAPLGMCGLLKRDDLEDIEVGFALLPKYWSHGYAKEAAAATLVHGRSVLGLKRIAAITAADNDRSGRLLEKLGLRFEKMVQLKAGAPEVKLFATES